MFQVTATQFICGAPKVLPANFKCSANSAWQAIEMWSEHFSAKVNRYGDNWGKLSGSVVLSGGKFDSSGGTIQVRAEVAE